MPAVSSTSPVSNVKPPRRRRFRKVRLAALLLILFVASLFVPAVFQYVLRELIVFEAWRHAAEVQIGDLQGSFFEPVAVTDIAWNQHSRNGAVTRLEIRRAEADFAWRWRDVVSRARGRWFRRLTVAGVTGKIELAPVSETQGHSEAPGSLHAKASQLFHSAWWPVPERLEAEDVNFVIQSNDDTVRIEDSGCIFSQVEPGSVHARRIEIKQPWLARTFRDVHGTTAIQDSKALVAHLVLEPGVELLSLSAELGELARGRLSAELQLAAFGGNLHAQIRTLHDEPGAGFDSSVNFSQIGIAPLATFLSLSDAAGGVIKEGQFNFRGTPRNVSRSTASLRLEANNFQWESRQWDSLVLGATLMDRRIEVPVFELHQGHNQLKLTEPGELTLPAPGTAWWQSDFSFNLSAAIDNLTELSALMLPEFTYTAGRMNIDGIVRGHAEQFHGSVIVSGSGITWHNAPIEDLRAAIRLNGNEVRIENLDLLNKDDFVRARGGINILGPKQYWGEFRASIADLGTYASILQKPIVPEPLAGGAVIDWSGEGSAKGYSGKFFARLNKLRTVGSTGAMLHPVNAQLEGGYTTGSMQFSRFAVSDDESSLTANVTVGNKALSLGSIRLMHGADVWLEGDAILPLDVWQAWPNTSLDRLLTEQTLGKVNLTARHLQLHEAAQLAGWKWPIEGIVDGTLTGEGKLGALTTAGLLTLSNGRIPLGWSGDALSNVQAEFGLAGQILSVQKFQCTAPERGEFTAGGQIDFQNIRDPALQLTLHSSGFTMPIFTGLRYQAEPIEAANSVQEQLSPVDGVQVGAALDLQITGPATAAVIQGKAPLGEVWLGGIPEVLPFLKNTGPAQLPPLFSWRSLPWRNWRFDIDAHQSAPIAITPSIGALWSKEQPGVILPLLKLTGSGAAPALVGSVEIADFAALTGATPSKIEGTITFREGFPEDPSVDLRVTHTILDYDIVANTLGPISHCLRFLTYDSALPPANLRAELAEAASAAPDSEDDHGAWLQSVPLALAGHVPIYDWEISRLSEPGNPLPDASGPPIKAVSPEAIQ